MAGLSVLARLLVFYGISIPNHPRKWWLHDRLRRLCGVTVNGDQTVIRQNLQWLLNPGDYADASLFWFGNKDPWDIFHLSRMVNRAETTVDELDEFFGRMGYKLFIPTRDRLEPATELPRGDDPVNVIAFHDDRPAASFMK